MKKYKMFKGRRMHVNDIAAISRKTTVKNVNKTMPDVHEYKRYYDGEINNAITCPFTGHKFIPTNPHPIPSQRFGFTITGYDWIEPEEKLWLIPEGGFKQPKCLRKKYKKKYYNKNTDKIRKIVEHTSDYTAFPKHEPVRMNKIEYCEKLVQHKTAKWERKNPKPMDMFTEDVEKWKQLREMAVERIRDFVVSMYDKLPLTGRFCINKDDASATYMEEKVAELKDINGDGHRVNEMTEHSPLLKKAEKVTNEIKAKRSNLIATNLKDHKREKGRMILPNSNMQKAA